MAFELVLERAGSTDRSDAAGEHRDIGDNVVLSDLSGDYRCYVFYYPGAMPDPELEQALRALGEQTGKNLFVNIGRLNDPSFAKITRLFDIKRYPVIVLTAIAPLAAPDGFDLNSYVRLDAPKLLASREHALQCVQEIFTLFLQGKIAEAIATGKSRERSELLRAVVNCIKSPLAAVWKFISERDISVSFVTGRFELKRSGG